MPKRSRKPLFDRKKMVRFVAIVIVFGLFASLLIGAIASTPASATTLTENCVPDIDGDGKANGIDEDVDGDGFVNGTDDDIDGDSITNFKDQDPVSTNCTVDAQLPLVPKNDEPDAGFIAALLIGILAVIPVAYFASKTVSRRRK